MNFGTEIIIEQLDSLSKSSFTGRLEIRTIGNKQWLLFFRLGRLIWGENSYHANRFCQRNLQKYCPQLELKTINIRKADEIECYSYQLLSILFHRKSIEKEQLQAIVRSQLADIFFDIIKSQARERLNYKILNSTNSPVQKMALITSFALVDVEEALDSAQKKWEIWCNKGLISIDPNYAPRIENLEELRRKVPDIIYNNLTKSIDGNKTLRDLAYQTNTDLTKLTCSLISYIKNGLLKLVKIPDIQVPIELVKPPLEAPETKITPDRPLIACIDDSKQVINVMEQIINKAGYPFIGIKEPLKVLPQVIANNPSLIFLDLVMPLVSGYEIYSQIRRVSQLKEVPIIILTGNDSPIDKVRTKIIGASDFLSKPIEEQKVLQAIELKT